jgi:hypothetical protein
MGPVSGEKYRTSCTKGRGFRRRSLLDEFSISEIWAREPAETGCVSAETGSTWTGSAPRMFKLTAVRRCDGIRWTILKTVMCRSSIS